MTPSHDAPSLPALESILVTTDLSDLSDPILRTAASLSEDRGAALHVIHAFDERQLPQASERPTFQGRIAEAEHLLSQQIQRCIGDAGRVSSRELVIYEAGKAIVERAREVQADLIVLGPHRRRSFADAYLGSTADYVVHHAEADCLIVRGGLDLPLGAVVVSTDFSESARSALLAAAGWLHAFGRPDAELLAVHVMEPSLGVDSPTAQLEAEVEAIVRSTAADAGRVRPVALEGEAVGEALAAFAERERADLLVIATSGYGALKRVLIGSVASSVARSAPCSVLLVRAGSAVPQRPAASGTGLGT
ncbi:MAG: universal stress protein [Longimicrobiales bacterium]